MIKLAKRMIGGRVAKPALVSLLYLIALCLVACSKEKAPIHIVKISLPNYCDDSPTTTVPILVAGKIQESMTFAKSKKAATAQQYSEWFKKNGWTPLTAGQDVNSLEEIYTKDNVQLTMNYTASRGLTFFATRPEAEYKSAAEPSK